MTRIIIYGLSIRAVFFYSLDYFIFSSVGFFGRDIEIINRSSRNIFTVSIEDGGAKIVERNIIGGDIYGRPSPDVKRQPQQIGCLAIEVKYDFVDETYRSMYNNGRVDNIYTGAFEQKFFDFFTKRYPKFIFRKMQKKIRIKKKYTVFVREKIPEFKIIGLSFLILKRVQCSTE